MSKKSIFASILAVLILAGGVEVGADKLLSEIETKIKGKSSIEIIKSPSFTDLTALYAKAKFFWTASGFGVDEMINPSKVEHFGISLVEAISSGCISFAFKSGGHKEIISHGKNGFLWTSIDELVELTKTAVKNENQSGYISQAAIKDSNKYSLESFKRIFLDLLGKSSA